MPHINFDIFSFSCKNCRDCPKHYLVWPLMLPFISPYYNTHGLQKLISHVNGSNFKTYFVSSSLKIMRNTLKAILLKLTICSFSCKNCRDCPKHYLVWPLMLPFISQYYNTHAPKILKNLVNALNFKVYFVSLSLKMMSIILKNDTFETYNYWDLQVFGGSKPPKP